MTAIWRSAVTGLRRRVPIVVALVLLVGATGGVAIAGLAGSRRAETSFDRLLDATLAPEIDVEFPEPPDADVVDRVAAVDGVDGATFVAYVAVAPAAPDLVPFQDTIGFAVLHESGTGALGQFYVAGRGLGDDPDELVVNEAMADVLGADVGDDVELWSISRATGERWSGEGVVAVDGPRTTATLVGISRGAEDVSDSPDPIVVVPRAYTEAYDVFSIQALLGVRVDDDRRDQVVADLHELLPGADVEPSERFDRRIQDGIAVQSLGLVALAGVVGFAGAAAVVQFLSRITSAEARDDDVRGALGMTMLQRRAVAAVRALPIALVGAALAVLGGVLGGPLALTGLARQAEPDRGVWFDAPVVLGVTGAFVVVVLAAAALGVRRTRRDRGAPAAGAAVRSVLASRLSFVAVLGARRAVSNWTGRAGLVAVMASFGIVVTVLTFARSIDVLFDDPVQWGVRFDAIVAPGTDEAEFEEVLEFAAADDRIAGAGVAVSGFVTARTPAGETVSYNLTSLDTITGPGDWWAVVDGQAVPGDGEAVVGAEVLDDLGLRIGDHLEIETDTGVHRVPVVGQAVTYSNDSIDDGIQMTAAGAEAIGVEPEDAFVIVRFAENVDARAAIADLQDRFTIVEAPERPGSVDNLDELGLLPLVLAGLVTGLGALAGGLALTAGTSRSRRELATLRALGASRGQVARTVLAHALTLAGIGVVVGTPLGIALGRIVYFVVAEGIGAIGRAAVPASAIAVLAAGAAGAAMVVAVPPALQAARRRPALALRSE